MVDKQYKGTVSIAYARDLRVYKREKADKTAQANTEEL